MSARPARGVFFPEHDQAEALREIVAPEGVPLRFRVANVGERAGAFLVDLCVIALLLLAFSLGLLLLGAVLGSQLVLAVMLLVVFLLTNFYFVWFEGRRQGATPGKKLVGLRVIDRRGGPLTAEAVLARNLSRNVELIVPLAAFFAPEALRGDRPGWLTAILLAWVAVLLLLPAFNRDRLRVGDLIAGTLVVAAPRARLLPDVAARAPDGTGDSPYVFSPAQLEVYGIYELQVLEQVLRDEGAMQIRKLRVVARKIAKKIDWPDDPADLDVRRFLDAFYRALRAHHEGKVVLGERQEFKRDGGGAPRRAAPP
ncbi:MAG: RDD family protein [Planctomycetota bacterium JB042]